MFGPSDSDRSSEGPNVFVVGAGGAGVLFGYFSFPCHFCHFSFLSFSLWEARYRLKFCLKKPLNRKQPIKTNKTVDYHLCK